MKRAERPLLALACALIALLPTAAPADAAARSKLGPFTRALLRELNHARAQYGLAPVRDDARMDRGAAAHSRAMAASGSVTHGSWTGRVASTSRSARSVGEVLGWLSPGTPRGEAAWLVRTWLGSPTHRTVVLGTSFRRVGIGRMTGSIGGAASAIYTVDFASAR
ncbi:MAG TPA: CAP domain-containing protein [Conexibacter sp.]|nr:CAP domain-containing protein [Conexibacter sp.]